MLSSRVRVPAKDEYRAGGPRRDPFTCQGLSVCAVLYAQACASRFLLLRMPSLVTDQKQFVLHMIIPAIAAALACGLPKLQQVLPRCLMRLISLPWMFKPGNSLGSSRFPRAEPAQRPDLSRFASCSDPLLSFFLSLRRFQFGLSGVELRPVGLTLAKASWSHRCSWSTLGNASASPVPLIMTRPPGTPTASIRGLA